MTFCFSLSENGKKKTKVAFCSGVLTRRASLGGGGGGGLTKVRSLSRRHRRSAGMLVAHLFLETQRAAEHTKCTTPSQSSAPSSRGFIQKLFWTGPQSLRQRRKSIMAKKCKYSHSGPTRSLCCPCSAQRNDGHVRSDCGRLSGKASIHQPACCRNSCFFSNTCMHILIPSLSVLCFIDVREVISAVRLPSAFVKHSFASCNIITPGRNWTERRSV